MQVHKSIACLLVQAQRWCVFFTEQCRAHQVARSTAQSHRVHRQPRTSVTRLADSLTTLHGVTFPPRFYAFSNLVFNLGFSSLPPLPPPTHISCNTHVQRYGWFVKHSPSMHVRLAKASPQPHPHITHHPHPTLNDPGSFPCLLKQLLYTNTHSQQSPPPHSSLAVSPVSCKTKGTLKKDES